MLRSSFEAGSIEQGLEKIYSFETVDAKSVRKMAGLPQESVSSTAENQITSNIDPQLLLDYGLEFGGGLPHIALRERLEALKLSPTTIRVLRGLSLETVLDVYNLVSQHLQHSAVHPGMLEELKYKLRELLGSRDPRIPQPKVCWKSALRFCFAGLSNKVKAIIALQGGFSELIDLPATDYRDAERLLDRKESLLVSQAVDDARYSCSPNIRKFFEDLYLAYIKPWLMNSEGFETEDQILEACTFYADEEMALVLKSIRTLERVLGHAFLFQSFMAQSEGSIWAIREDVAAQIRRVLDSSVKITCNNQIPVSIASLTKLIQSDWKNAWEMPTDSFIQKALLCS